MTNTVNNKTYYEQCKDMIKQLNAVAELPQNQQMTKALKRKVGALKELIISYELGYSVDSIMQDVLRESNALLMIAK